MIPLKITAELYENAPVCTYDRDAPIHLDNLLTWAVIGELTGGQGVGDEPHPHVPWNSVAGAHEPPLPLQILWRDPETRLPLYASTVFRPAGETAPDTVYRHRRAHTGEWSRTDSKGRFTIVTNQGRFQERQIPVPATVTMADDGRTLWEARCIGDAERIAELLRKVATFGKERARGFGTVRCWHIDTMDEHFFITGDDGRLLRPVPASAVSLLGIECAAPATRIGWTPPQWKRPLHSPGYRTGTFVRRIIR